MDYDTRCAVCSKQEARPCYIGFFDSKDIFSCDVHYEKLYDVYIRKRARTICDPGSSVDSWSHQDKKTGKTIKHKVTKGKEWEIKQRVLAEDKVTVINKMTGKETQY